MWGFESRYSQFIAKMTLRLSWGKIVQGRWDTRVGSLVSPIGNSGKSLLMSCTNEIYPNTAEAGQNKVHISRAEELAEVPTGS